LLLNAEEVNDLRVLAEKVTWDNVLMLRTRFNEKKRSFDTFDIPDELFTRWNEAIDEMNAVESEIRKYMSGEKMMPR